MLQIPVTQADLSLAALRELNEADGQTRTLASQHDPTAAVRTFSSKAPSFVKKSTFLSPDKRSKQEVTSPGPKGPSQSPLKKQADWPALEAILNQACAKLQDVCKHKPNVFSLSLLTQALCTAGNIVHGPPKISRWVEYWQTDVLAGLLLRAKAESLYQHSAADSLPQGLNANLSDTATARCAAVLHLQPSEVTWAAVYVHFLDEARAFLQTNRENAVDVFLMGTHLAKLFRPQNSQEATSPTPVLSPVGSPPSSPQPHFHPHDNFWAHDALAGYLLASLIRLLDRQPMYPDMPEAILPNEISLMVRPAAAGPNTPPPPPSNGHPKQRPQSQMGIQGQLSVKADLQADAESAQPHDTCWLLTEATAALKKLADQIKRYIAQDATAAMAAVERLALALQDQKPEVLQFLGEVANIGSADATFAKMTELPSDTPVNLNSKTPAKNSNTPAKSITPAGNAAPVLP